MSVKLTLSLFLSNNGGKRFLPFFAANVSTYNIIDFQKPPTLKER